MGLLDRYRKRRAITAFSKRLGPALSERFGPTPYYTANQIEDLVGSGSLRRHRRYLAYAYCLFMSQKAFEALDADIDVPGDFDALRSEAFGLIGPGPGIAPPTSTQYGDPFQGPDDFDAGDGGPGI